jgi:hypothetical protein
MTAAAAALFMLIVFMIRTACLEENPFSAFCLFMGTMAPVYGFLIALQEIFRPIINVRVNNYPKEQD